jgi:leucyl aminopeptidase
MKVGTAAWKSFDAITTDLLVIPVREGDLAPMKGAASVSGASKSKQVKRRSPVVEFDEVLGGVLRQPLAVDRFQGKTGQTFFTYTKAVQCSAVLLVGLPGAKLDRFQLLQGFRKLGSAVFEAASRCRAARVSIAAQGEWPADTSVTEAFLEGFHLTNYRFERYKSKKSEQPYEGCESLVFLGGKIGNGLAERVETICNATKYARDLVNIPARDCTPSFLVEAAKTIAHDGKLSIEVLDRKKLEKLGANALLAVAQGSDEPPFLIKLTYKPKRSSRRSVAIVGKGVTFDTGGYSLKPAGGMESMKGDMGGAAAVLGAMRVVAALKPDIEVRAYIPTVENMVNGKATRPGDVVTALSGKTIEILNTDAEGRLILADAIAYAVREKPDSVIDLATLTGACVVALGEEYAGLFTDDDKLLRDLGSAAERSGERLWRMPLAPEYVPHMKSAVSDLKNIGGGKGGAIFGALFIREFVGDTPWAHLDIAGTAQSDGDKDFIKKGGTGFGVRTLSRYLLDR